MEINQMRPRKGKWFRTGYTTGGDQRLVLCLGATVSAYIQKQVGRWQAFIWKKEEGLRGALTGGGITWRGSSFVMGEEFLVGFLWLVLNEE